MLKIYVVSSIANIAAPTTAELNAGTAITNFVTKDGLTVPANQNYVDNSSLAETYDAQVVGSFGGPVTMIGIRDNATDTFWDLVVYGTATHLAVRRGTATATAWGAGNKLEVYPIMWHEPLPVQTASNEQGRFTAAAAVRSQPNLKAVAT
jgi:hypothetical protein